MIVRGGETTATFRTKALFLCVRAMRGRPGANRFVQAVGAGRIFEDETKPVSRELWLRALLEFEKLLGEEGFRRLTRYVVHPKNLGVWSGLLRAAQEPKDIYQLLDVDASDFESGWVWRQRRAGPRSWSGEICFLETDTEADRRRIRKALGSELRAIPLLFGLDPAVVTTQVERTPDGREEVVQSATWAPANATTLRTGAVAVLLSAAAGVAAAHVLGLSGAAQASVAALSGAVCALVTTLLARDVSYRAASRAQHLRILALEREATLQKQQVKEISRPHEEPVLAGKYRLSQQLGSGAAGAVWQAKRLTDGATVAIKLLRTALAQDPRATDRLRREAQALGLSWHPHVVEVLDDGVLPSGVAFLVTELLRGETLSERVRRRGALPASEVARWGVQAADALAAVHSAGVVHRDVKPDNLFLHSSSKSGEVLKLIDFGIASVSWAETRLTRHGTRVGTQGYAAPEQEEGAEVDARADLFSLGQTLKFALTGSVPDASESHTPKPPPDHLVPEWAKLIRQLTATDPQQRPASARDARRILNTLLEGDDKTDPRFRRDSVMSVSDLD